MLVRLVFPSVLLLCTGISTAQPRQPRGNPLETVAKFLDLSQAQVDQVKDLMEKRRTEAAPLRENLRLERSNLREMMKTAEPNPAIVGETYIRIHSLRQQLADAQRTFIESFENILNDEQKAKLRTIRRFRRIAPFLRAFRGIGLD